MLTTTTPLKKTSEAETQTESIKDSLADNTATSVTNKDVKPRRLRKDQIEQLIKNLAQYRPKNCTEIQFYNYVRECCIIYNCSIKDAIARSKTEWRKLTLLQQSVYSSKMHAVLPIPVPITAIYDALKDEQLGHLTLIKSENTTRPKYFIENFNPQYRKKLYADVEAKVITTNPQFSVQLQQKSGTTKPIISCNNSVAQIVKTDASSRPQPAYMQPKSQTVATPQTFVGPPATMTALAQAYKRAYDYQDTSMIVTAYDKSVKDMK